MGHAGRATTQSLAVAGLELHCGLKSIRMLLYGLVAAGFTAGSFLLLTHVHTLYSGGSPSAGMVGPRNTVHHINAALSAIAMLGAAVFAAKAGSRDFRDGIFDALAARPFSNSAMLMARFTVVTLAAWLPIVASLVLTQAVVIAGNALGWFAADAIGLRSIARFTLLDLLPTLAFWGGIVSAVAATAPKVQPLMISVVAAITLGIGAWAAQFLPVGFADLVPPIADNGRLASELAPHELDAAALLFRFSLVLIGVGLVYVSAFLHVRPCIAPDSKLVLAGAAFIVVAVVATVLVGASRVASNRERETWRAYHHETGDMASTFAPDLTHVDARVRIEPGDRVVVDTEMAISTHAREPRLVFSFNPGLRVGGASVNGVPSPVSHRHGLLTVPLEHAADHQPVLVRLNASGVPDPDFAYLDQAVPRSDTRKGYTLRSLGTKASVFATSYVALTPALHWLPTPGPNLDRRRSRDFFTADITVEVPADWLVAGPGVRTAQGQGLFRFRPAAAISEIALFASRFARRAATVDGLEVELLVHEGHTRNADLFADAVTAMSEQLGESFRSLRRSGADYPFRGLSIVEVPPQLRSYGGGCFMRGRMAYPGILLIRETGFPTADFVDRLKPLQPYSDRPDVVAHSKAYMLTGYVRADAKGADSLRGLAENLMVMTGAGGDGAAVLDLLLLELASRMFPLHSNDGAMSALTLGNDDRGYLGVFGTLMASLAVGRLHRIYDTASRDTPGAWEAALSTSLMDAVKGGDCRKGWNVVALRAPLLAESLFDSLGAERVGTLLAEIRRRFQGRTFSRSDLMGVWRDLDLPHPALLDSAFDSTALPGFLASVDEVARLGDAPNGDARYEVRVNVANDEGTAGLAYLSLDRYGWGERSETFEVGPHSEVVAGLVLDHVPEQVWLQTYMSLNRTAVQLRIHGPEQGPATTVSTPVGVVALGSEDGASTLAGGIAPGIASAMTVDDLDTGFTAQSDPAARSEWLEFGRPAPAMDRGLPLFQQGNGRLVPGRWVRRTDPGAWGKYRRTLAICPAGSGAAHVALTTHLPSDGLWRLDLHLPQTPLADVPGDRPAKSLLDSLGEYEIVVQAGSAQTEVQFDAGTASPGWNRLRSFELEAGETTVVVTNRTDGDVIVVDAIRWHPLGQVSRDG
ncbi:MAG: hypothetical protein OXH52_06970 [Gammaproteobacteria bacterium]|nr:hypothetical protein [Gammaproteobacteria bacterium]